MHQQVVSRIFQMGEQDIPCIFHRPVREDDDHYRCNYEIAFPSWRRAFRAYGVDEVQALLHAMGMAHADILASDEYQNQGLMWLGMRDLGLPLAGGLSAEDFGKSSRKSR